jgi:membrane protein DedA with SNARE-associated domain
LKNRFVAKILHPERFAKLERRFEQNGNWAIFTCRFLPGLRIPGYFTAGTLRMSYARFMLIDSFGVLISVPTSIFLAKLFFDRFGDDLEGAQKDVSRYNRYILFGVIAVIVGFWIWRKIRKRRKEAIEAATIDGP